MADINIKHKLTGTFEFFSSVDENGNPTNKIGEQQNEIQWNFLDYLSTGMVRGRDVTGYNMYYSSSNRQQWRGAMHTPYLFLGDDETAATKWDGKSADGGHPLCTCGSASLTENYGTVKNEIMGSIPKSSIYTYDSDANGLDKHSVLFKVTPTSTFNIAELGVTGNVHRTYDGNHYRTAISRATPETAISVTEGETIYILYTISINTDTSLDGWQLVGLGSHASKNFIGDGSEHFSIGVDHVGLSVDGTAMDPMSAYYNTDNHILQNTITYTDVVDVINNGGQKLRGTEIEVEWNNLPVATYESMTVFIESKSLFRKLNTLEVTDATNVYNVKILISFT